MIVSTSDFNECSTKAIYNATDIFVNPLQIF